MKKVLAVILSVILLSSVFIPASSVLATSPADLIDYVEIDPVTIVENTKGYSDTDSSGEQYWHYDLPSPMYVIHYKDGSMSEKMSGWNMVGNTWYNINLSDNQYEKHWTKGTNTVNATFAGVECSFDVIIQENPVDYVEIDPVTIIENTDGYIASDDNNEQFWYYSSSLLPQYIVHYKDGRVSQKTAGWTVVDNEWFNVNVYDNQYKNHWTKGTNTVKATFAGVECSFDVIIKESPVERVEFENISIIEETSCMQDIDSSGNKYSTYHYTPKYTVYFNDGTPATTVAGGIEIYGQTYYPDYTDNQYNEHWQAGNTYTIPCSFMGIESSFDVTMKESPVERIEFEPISLSECTNGNWYTDLSGERYWSYNIPTLNYTVYFNDGTPPTKAMQGLYLGDEYYFLFYNTFDLQRENHWEVGNTYTVPCTFMGKEYSFDVTIKGTAVERIEVENVSIIEGTNCLQYIDKKGNKFWCYNPSPKYTVYFNDGTPPKTTTGSIQFGEQWYSLSVDADDSQMENHWEAGNTYTVPCSFMGKESSFDVTITKSPVERIEVKNVSVVAGFDVETAYGYTGEYLRYVYSRPEYTVYFNDGTPAVTTTGSVLIGDRYYSLEYSDNQHEEQWKVGKTYTVPCSFFGVQSSFEVTVEKNHVTGIEILNVEKLKKSDSESGEHYSIPDFSYRLITDNGTDIYGTYRYIDYWWEPDPRITVTDDQDVHPWTAGGNNEFTVTMYGFSTKVKVEIENDCDYDYFEQDDGIIITDCFITDENITIPEKIDGKNVIGVNCNFHSKLKSITIPAGVKYLTYSCFEQCENLQNIFVNSGNAKYADIDGVLTNKAKTKILAYPLAKGNTYNIPGSITDTSELNTYSYADIQFIVDDTAYKTVDGVTYSADMTKVIKADSELSGTYVMPESVTEMADYAFSGCSSLTEIKISSKVTDITYFAFGGCSALQSVELPKSLSSIKEYAFEGCESLESVYYNGTGSDWCGVTFAERASNPMGIIDNFYTNGQLLTDLVVDSSVSKINDYAFAGYKALKSVTFGSGVKTIGDLAFANCEGLTSVTIPDNVETLGFGAFDECQNLESITIGAGLKAISDSAFSCTGIKTITIPGNIKTIGDNAFVSCQNLETFDIPDSVEEIGVGVFGDCSNLKSVKIGKGLKEISDSAFIYSGLESITIPDNIKVLGSYVFSSCQDLKTVNIGAGLSGISQGAFENCYSLESITIPKNIDTIGEGAFYYCQNLKTVIFENDNVEIGADAFRYCDLSNTTLPKNIKKIEDSTFYGTNITTADIPNTVTEIVYHAFAYSEVESIGMPSSVQKISAFAFDGTPWLGEQPDGPVYIEHILYYYKGDIPANTELEVKPGTTVIADSALGYNDDGWYESARTSSGLKKVILPEGLKYIGDGAFHYCEGLTEINIPASVERIGERAFAGCSSLKSLSVAADNPYFTLENGILFTKDKTEIVYCLPSKYQTYEIPATVTKIRAFAFCDCYGATIVFNNSDVEIEDYAIGYAVSRGYYDCRLDFTGYKIICEEGSDADAYRNNNLLAGKSKHLSSHTGTEIRNARAATCTQDGYTGDTYCTVCGERISAGKVIAATEHIAKTVIENPTVNKKGYNKKVCKICGEVLEQEEIEALGVTYNIESGVTNTSENISVAPPSGSSLPENTQVKATSEVTEDKITYEIHLENDKGETINPEEKVLVRLPIPAGIDISKINVYRMESNGAKTRMNVIVDGDFMYFETEHFSYYEIIEKLCGDINNDNSVNNKDLIRLLKYLSNWNVIVNEKTLDINGDGKVNNKDLLRLLKYISGWEVDIF